MNQLNPQDYNHLNSQNILAYMRALEALPQIQGFETDWGIAINTPVNSPALNFVVSKEIESIDLQRMAEYSTGFYSDFNSSFSWWPLPGGSLQELQGILLFLGFTMEYFSPWMALDLKSNDSCRHFSLTDQFSIYNSKQPDSAPIFLTWSEAYCEGFDLANHQSSGLRLYTSDLIASQDPNLYLFALAENLETVATGLLYQTGHTAGLYSISVRPDYRGYGLGKTLTQSILQFAKNLGCTVAILQSSEAGKNFYQNLGFIQTWLSPVYKWEYSK